MARSRFSKPGIKQNVSVSQPTGNGPAYGPHGSNAGPGGGPGGPTPLKESDADRAVARSFSGVYQALVASGIPGDQATRFARVLLSRPGVAIGPTYIRYKGKRYKPADFAASPLADYVTGKAAEEQNRAAIESEPGYLQALAQLGLQRDVGVSSLEDQRRRSLLDFGDPGFTDDPLLAAQGRANPFSTVNLLAKADAEARARARQAANVAGTLFGGGLESGMNEASRVNAARQTEATSQLRDLLAGLDRQRTEAGNIYNVGATGALSEATQRLMASGAIHAAAPPVVKPRRPRYYDPRKHQTTQVRF